MLGAEFIKAQLALRNKPSGPPVAVAATKSAEAEEARQNVHSAPYASSLLRCDRTVDDACIRAARVWRRRAPCRAHLQHRAGQRACLNGDPPQRHSIVAKPPNGMVRRRLATVRGSAKPIVSLEFFPPKTRAGVEVRARPANADAACTLNRACEHSFRARKKGRHRSCRICTRGSSGWRTLSTRRLWRSCGMRRTLSSRSKSRAQCSKCAPCPTVHYSPHRTSAHRPTSARTAHRCHSTRSFVVITPSPWRRLEWSRGPAHCVRLRGC